MTIGQAKQIVRFLLDGALYNQYEEKLAVYLDLGQKRIACTTAFLERETEVEVNAPIEYDLETLERFYRLRRVEGGKWQKLSPTRLRLQGGRYRILYNIYPQTITPHTDDGTELEISPTAQIALPYFVASQVTMAEHDLCYYQIYADQFASVLESAAAAEGTGKMHVVTGGEI